MTNRDHTPEWRPLDFARCIADLGVLAVKELAYTMDKALDTAWPDDEPEDQEIRSGRFA